MRTEFIRLMLACGAFLWPFVPAGAEDTPTYWNLGGEDSAAGHIVVRVSPNRTVPPDWTAQWFVSLYSPKGLRLRLADLEDGGPADRVRVTVRVPAGKYKIEIARPPGNRQGLGAFNLDEGRWEPSGDQSEVSGAIEVAVAPGQVRVVDIVYTNAQAASKEEGDRKTTVSTWQNFRLVQAEGGAADVPKEQPRPHPLLKGGRLAALDVPDLLRLLGDKDASDSAVETLMRVEHPPLATIVPALADGSIRLTSRVAALLARGREKQAVPALIAKLADKAADEDARASAAWALGRIGDPAAAEALIAALKDASVLVRCHAAFALGGVRHPASVDALAAAANDTSGLPSSTMIFTTKTAEWPRLFIVSQNSVKVIPPLSAYIVRPNAIHALGEVRDPKAAEVLLKMASGGEEEVRREAFQALSNYPEPRVRAFAQEKLNDDKWRTLAVVVLYRVGDKGSIEALSAVAKSAKDEGTRDLAGLAIKKIQGRLNPPKPAPAPRAGPARKAALATGVAVAVAVVAWAGWRRGVRKS